MIVLTTSSLPQTFACIPRSGISTMVITDDQTNTPQIVPITQIAANDYVVNVTATFDLTEGHFYDLVLKQGSTIVYKDRIFCTDQNVTTFSVNAGQYTSNTTSNTYIVYE
jgi:aconitase A